MKKILILSYYFPPANFAGSYRIASWAKFLHEFGFYPVVITRKWDDNSNNYENSAHSTTKGVEHKKFKNYEVYYLPYKSNLRDRIYLRNSDQKFVLLRKFLSFWEVFLQNYFICIVSFKNLYFFSKAYLKKNPDISIIITSVSPYILLRFCYKLQKKIKIKWIADYRDEWTTGPWTNPDSTLKKLIFNIEQRKEINWVKTASCIISVSDHCTKRIKDFTGVKGYTVLNGFEIEDYDLKKSINYFEEFTIVYNGTLYFTQPVEIFLEGYKKVIDHFNNKIKIKIRFHGLSIDAESAERVKQILKGYETNYSITDRIPHKDLINIQRRSNLLLIIGTPQTKGIYSSKIYEYLACNKPILLCPSDKDVIEELIKITNTGSICNTEQEVVEFLRKAINDFINQKEISYNPDYNEINKYTRYNQAKKLAEIINKIV